MNWNTGAGDLWQQGKVFVSGTDTNCTENFGENGLKKKKKECAEKKKRPDSLVF